MVTAGQDVFIQREDVFALEGRCLRVSGEKCLIQMGKVNQWFEQRSLEGRQWIIFDASTGQPADETVYKNLRDAIDAEEDFAYDILEMGEEPLLMEVWEVNTIGEKMNKVVLE